MRTSVQGLVLFCALPLLAQPDAPWSPVGLEGERVTSIAIDPLFSSVLFATTPSGVFRTVDGGASWTSVGPVASPAGEFTQVWATRSAVFAATREDHLYRSYDFGDSWDPTWLLVPAFAASETYTWFTGTLSSFTDALACYLSGLSPCRAKLTRGDSSGRVSGAPRYFHATPISVASVPASEMVFVGFQGEIWRSSSGYEPVPGAVTQIVAATSQAAYALAWTNGVATVLRRGRSGWTEAGPGLPQRVETLAVDRSAPETVFAGTSDGVFETTDGGLTWSRQGLDGSSVRALAIDPSSPGTLYAGTSRGVYVRRSGAAAPCVPSGTVQCLDDDRFRVEAVFRTADGRQGRAKAERITPDTASFWFFDPANVELVVKVLDGTSVNGNHWVFTGALSAVQYEITVTDTRTGAQRRYLNPLGRLSSFADGAAFPESGGPSSPPIAVEEAEPAASTAYLGRVEACSAGALDLCLNDGRFRVAVSWLARDGRSGFGEAVPLTSDTGYFWFFDDGNVELVVKVLDGRPVNGHFWVFSGGLSNVAYTITVTDAETGIVRTYENPQGRLASFADTQAF